jgi:hypothetical protein
MTHVIAVANQKGPHEQLSALPTSPAVRVKTGIAL